MVLLRQRLKTCLLFMLFSINISFSSCKLGGDQTLDFCQNILFFSVPLIGSINKGQILKMIEQKILKFLNIDADKI